MKPHQKLAGSLLVVAMMFQFACYGQVIVNGKNLNEDKNLAYIQLMYYADKSTFAPVFFVDHGFIEPEYSEIIEPELSGQQQITVNGEEVTDRVTVVWVLNRMHQAGWEYMGDVVFVPLRSMNNWHVFTLRRKANLQSTAGL